MVDMTDHLQLINKPLQSRYKLVTESYNTICAFKLQLQLFENQLAGVPNVVRGRGAAFSKGTFNIVRSVISTNIAL